MKRKKAFLNSRKTFLDQHNDKKCDIIVILSMFLGGTIGATVASVAGFLIGCFVGPAVAGGIYYIIYHTPSTLRSLRKFRRTYKSMYTLKKLQDE